MSVWPMESRYVTIDDVRKKQEKGERFTLIDVREDHEWAKGHLPGAQHLGKGIIERDMTIEGGSDVPTLRYCDDCIAGERAEEEQALDVGVYEPPRDTDWITERKLNARGIYP